MRKILISITGVLLVVLVPLGLAELILRLIDYPKQTVRVFNEQGTLIYVKSKAFHHDYQPTQTFYVYKGGPAEDEPVLNQINSFGMRGTEPVIGQKKRVLFLGDSFVEADEIAEDKTFVSRLRTMLPTIDIYGKGISSWAPLLELNWFNKKGKELKPDIIVVVLFANDFYDTTSPYADATYTAEARFDANGLPSEFNITEDQMAASWYHQMRLFRLLKNTIQKLKQSPTTPNTGTTTTQPVKATDFYATAGTDSQQVAAAIAKVVNSIPDKASKIEVGNFLHLHKPVKYWSVEQQERIAKTFDYLRKLDSLAKVANPQCKVLCCSMPSALNIHPSETDYSTWNLNNAWIDAQDLNEVYRQHASRLGIGFLNFYDYLLQTKTQRHASVYLKKDGHLNDYGHEVFATFLQQAIGANE